MCRPGEPNPAQSASHALESPRPLLVPGPPSENNSRSLGSCKRVVLCPSCYENDLGASTNTDAEGQLLSY